MELTYYRDYEFLKVVQKNGELIIIIIIMPAFPRAMLQGSLLITSHHT
jgi:hypothetical protein